MQPNKYQEAVYNHIRLAGRNLVVDAKAGSGKTSTIVQALKYIPSTKSVLFVAFNKHIAEELQKRAPQHVEASTLNAFGYRTIRNSGMSPKIKDNKVRNIIWYKIYQEDNFQEFIRNVGAMCRLVSLFKAHNLTNPSVTDARQMAERYGLILYDDIAYVHAVNALQESLAQTQLIDFDDQLLYPIHFQLRIPRYDFVFVDEAQDLNPIQILLLQKASKGKIVAVGDTYQAIYGFRGADPDAINTIINVLEADVLPLSICYRCSKAVIREAQNIVPDIEFADTAEEGSVQTVPIAKYRETVTDGDWVLCRTTAPLVTEALWMLRNRRRAMVKGRQIGEALLALAERVEDLDAYEIEQSERLKKNEAALLELQDQCDTIRALLEAYGREGLKQGIEELFGESTIGITYCTVHRSKGLETNNVFLISPELLPHPKCTQDWQRRQEKNLQYIAITRAKRNFYYVEGKIGK